MAQWEGYGVTVRCGSPLGCYQGTILAADGASITLTKPFRNGFPYPKAQVTLKASDIKSLEIISGKTSGGTAHSTVPVAGKKKLPRATVGESLQEQAAAPPPPVASSSKAKPVKSKPIDIQGKPNRNNTHAGSYGASGSTPKIRTTGGDKARRRNEACFGSAALEAVDNDFDFEGNLALFDKEALWQQMRPDVVRVAAARDELAGGKLRHDENVLRGPAPAPAAVLLPAPLRAARGYVTDAGARLPAAAAAARAALWAGLRAAGAGLAAGATTLFARAAADVALKLVGGTRRLDPRNAHQRPRLGAAVGGGPGAAAGVAAARLLRAHGVDTYVLPLDETCPLVAAALEAYRLSGGRVLAPADARPAADLLLLALHDPETAAEHPSTPQALEWAASSRGALVLLEPGGGEHWDAVLLSARAVLAALLPPALSAPAPRLLLANVAPPPQIFTSLGISYRSPFGASSVLALHLADDDD